MLISNEWRELNEQYHLRRTDFGAGGWRWANAISTIARDYGCRSILDYGCGKNTLIQAMPEEYEFQSYDPAVPEFSGEPVPADMLVTIDVLEHIEPDVLGATLEHMAGLTKKVAVHLVATRQSTHVLSDGRRTHLVVKPIGWWLAKISQYWEIIEAHDLAERGYFHQWGQPRIPPENAYLGRKNKLRHNVSPALGREFMCLCLR